MGSVQVPSGKAGSNKQAGPVWSLHCPHLAGPGSSATLSRHPGLWLPSPTQPSSWKCQKTWDAGVCHGSWLRGPSEVCFPVCPRAQRAGLCWPQLLCPLPFAWPLAREPDSSAGSSRELPALGETSGKLLRSCKKMGSDCHSPSDCHSLIISGQRGWKYSLSLSNFAAAVVAIVAKD